MLIYIHGSAPPGAGRRKGSPMNEGLVLRDADEWLPAVVAASSAAALCQGASERPAGPAPGAAALRWLEQRAPEAPVPMATTGWYC